MRRVVVALAVSIGLAIAAFGAMNGNRAKEYARALWFFGAERPNPTGPFAVGRREIALSGDPWGTTTISLWYPTDAPRPGLLDRIRLRLQYPTSADFVEDAAWSGARPAFPLILHFPSWFSKKEETSFNLADLASHGFVVAAVDDIVHLDKLEGDAGKIQATGFDYASVKAFWASRVLAAQRSQMEARFGRFVIDALLAQPSVGEHLNASEIGASGMSFGGAAALELSLIDPRIKAIVNFDGPILGKAETAGIKVPYLVLFSDIARPTPEELSQPDLAIRFDRMMDGEALNYQERQAALPDNFTVLFKGAIHSDFTDNLLIPGLREALHPRSFERVETWRSIATRVSGFFGRYLRAPDQGAMGSGSAAPDAFRQRAPTTAVAPGSVDGS